MPSKGGHHATVFRVVFVALAVMMACAAVLAPRGQIDPELPTISLIEYSDFQCPYAAAGQPIVERVLAVYGQVVKYEYRHNTIASHPYALAAARRYEALRDRDGVAADHLRRLLFRSQGRLYTEGERFLDKVIAELGYDPELIAREAAASSIAQRLSAQMAEVDSRKLHETPSYVVAGIDLRGTTPFEEFEQVICGELRRVRYGADSMRDRESPDCWALVEPDWRRLDELENGVR